MGETSEARDEGADITDVKGFRSLPKDDQPRFTAWAEGLLGDRWRDVFEVRLLPNHRQPRRAMFGMFRRDDKGHRYVDPRDRTGMATEWLCFDVTVPPPVWPDPAGTPAEDPEYPHEDGDVLVLGPQVFVSLDGSVLNWRGRNYVPQADPEEGA